MTFHVINFGEKQQTKNTIGYPLASLTLAYTTYPSATASAFDNMRTSGLDWGG
jgi:hypothetical protein